MAAGSEDARAAMARGLSLDSCRTARSWRMATAGHRLLAAAAGGTDAALAAAKRPDASRSANLGAAGVLGSWSQSWWWW